MNYKLKVESALSTLGMPVKPLTYAGSDKPYCVFQRYNLQGVQYTEGREKVTAHYIQVDIYGSTDMTEFGDKAESLMIAAGATRIGGQSMYEDDTKLYHDSRDYLFEEI